MDIYELKAGKFTAKVTDFGATLTSWTYTKDDGKTIEITLGFDDLSLYGQPCDYYGATIGRFGNRINGGRFTMDGKQHQLNCNSNGHHLHGGAKGFDKHIWNAKHNGNTVEFSRVSPDGEEGYTGNLNISVTYTLTDDGTLSLDYKATTDAPTLLNPTNHTYFNLNGADSGVSIKNHNVTIHADHVLDVDGLIPNGKLIPVDGTAFDLRGGKVVADGMASGEPAIAAQQGYDHCYVPNGDGFREVARVSSPDTMLTLVCSTDLPGLQLYTGNLMTERTIRGGVTVGKHDGLCLESQYFPDAPNHENFAQPILRPGETFESKTSYKLIVG